MNAHVPRNRRKGREHLDVTVQAAPAAVNTAVPPGPADLSVFASMWADEKPAAGKPSEEYPPEAVDALDLSGARRRPDRHIVGEPVDAGKAEDGRKKGDETRRQAARLDLARMDDDGADRRRRIEDAARKRRQEVDRLRQETADQNRHQAVQRADTAAAAAVDARRRKARRERDRKPVPVFARMPSAEKVANLLEAFIKAGIFGGAAAFLRRRVQDVRRISSYVVNFIVPPLPEYRELFGLARQSLPAPAAVLAPSAERRPSPKPAAGPAPKAEFVPRSQADHDWKARQEWNPAEARKRAAEFYGSAAVLGSVARTLERGWMAPFDQDAIGGASPNLLKLLSGDYGHDEFEAYRTRFADLAHRLKDDNHAAERLMEPMLKAADEFERRPMSDLEPDAVPTDPPGDFSAGDEDTAPKASTPTAPTPRPGMKMT